MENPTTASGEPLSAVETAELLSAYVGRWSIELATGSTWTATRRRGSETRVVARPGIRELLGRLRQIEATEAIETLPADARWDDGGWISGSSAPPTIGGGQ